MNVDYSDSFGGILAFCDERKLDEQTFQQDSGDSQEQGQEEYR